MFSSFSKTVPKKSLKRLHFLIWSLIYGGLLTVVLGLSVMRSESLWGWWLAVGGAGVAALGTALIYVRSRLNVGSDLEQMN